MEFGAPERVLAASQVKSPENIALFKASLAGSLSGVETALANGGKPNFFFHPEEQKNALHVVAENGHFEIAKLLIDAGAVIDARSGANHNTALIIAAGYHSDLVVRLLLDHGADINAVNCYGNTALHEAARSGVMEIVEMLLNAGANVNATNKKGSTPLHFYCYGDTENGELHTVSGARELIQAGATVDARDSDGMTPLLVCCTSGREDIIDHLIHIGANQHAKDNLGRDPSQIATFHNDPYLMRRFGQDSPYHRFPDER